MAELKAEVHWHQQQYLQHWPGASQPGPASGQPHGQPQHAHSAAPAPVHKRPSSGHSRPQPPNAARAASNPTHAHLQPEQPGSAHSGDPVSGHTSEAWSAGADSDHAPEQTGPRRGRPGMGSGSLAAKAWSGQGAEPSAEQLQAAPAWRASEHGSGLQSSADADTHARRPSLR